MTDTSNKPWRVLFTSVTLRRSCPFGVPRLDLFNRTHSFFLFTSDVFLSFTFSFSALQAIQFNFLSIAVEALLAVSLPVIFFFLLHSSVSLAVSLWLLFSTPSPTYGQSGAHTARTHTHTCTSTQEELSRYPTKLKKVCQYDDMQEYIYGKYSTRVLHHRMCWLTIVAGLCKIRDWLRRL